MSLVSPPVTNIHVVYACHLALLVGTLLVGLGQLSRRTLPLYLAIVVLPLLAGPSGNPALTAFVFGVSAYLFAEILYLQSRLLASRGRILPTRLPYPSPKQDHRAG